MERAPPFPSYLVLLRMGFAKLPASPPGLVSSYLTVSPLSMSRHYALTKTVCFLWHFPDPLRGVVVVNDHPALWSSDFPLILSSWTSDHRVYLISHRFPGQTIRFSVLFSGYIADYPVGEVP